MDLLRQKLVQLRNFFVGMPTSQRISVALLAAVIVAALLMLRIEIGREDFVPLVTEPQLSPQEANAVLKELDKRNVPYELKAGTIYVPRALRDRLLIEFLGEEIIPADTRVWDWVFEESLTATPQRVNLQWLVTQQKVLERQIARLEEIESAGVLISPARETDVWLEADEATASVTVKLERGKTISPATARGIVKLVAGAVRNLKPANVTLVDTTGRVYRVPDDDAVAHMPTDQLEQKRNWEAYYENKVLGLFRDIRNVTAKVDVELDFTVKTESSRTAEHKSYLAEEETRESKDWPDAFTPGALGHQPPEPAGLREAGEPYVRPVGGGIASSETVARTIYSKPEITKETTTNISTPPGELRNVSLSLIVPLEHAADMTPAEIAALRAREKTVSDFTETEPKKSILQKRLKEWSEAAGNILGPKFAKNVSILPVFFAEPLPPPPPTLWEEVRHFLSENWPRIALACVLLISLLLIVLIVRKTTPADVLKELDRLRAELRAEEKIVAETLPPEVADTTAARMRERIRELIKRNPRAAAVILKKWMTK